MVLFSRNYSKWLKNDLLSVFHMWNNSWLQASALEAELIIFVYSSNSMIKRSGIYFIIVDTLMESRTSEPYKSEGHE